MKIEPGKYKGKVAKYGVVENAKGQQQVEVTFALENGSNFSYYGNLATLEQQKYTLKNLYILGATPENYAKVNQGVKSGVLDTNKTFELVVESRQFNGKTYTGIKYINDPSNAGGPKYVEGANALASLAGVAAQTAAEMGLKTAKNTGDAGF